MVYPKEETLVYGIKLSSVGPGRISGQDLVHEPTNMDLAIKLHYLRGVYYFRAPAFEGVRVQKLKDPMFTLFNHYYTTCGRFRRAEPSGRPYIKCNDCGARFIEAQCSKSLDEWLLMKDKDGSIERLLVSSQVIGPLLHFSPPVLIQFTWFRCGGVSVGLSWAHVLGDAFSATEFMRGWGEVLMGGELTGPINGARTHNRPKFLPSPLEPSEDPLSVKRVGPVGDHWIAANKNKMEIFSFRVSSIQLTQLQSKISSGSNGTDPFPPFESLCSIIWKCVAQVRDGPGPNLVTMCKNDPTLRKKGTLSNGLAISVVEAHFNVKEAHPKEIAALIMNQSVDERSKIEEAMERGQGTSDFLIYGANLTFVDLEEVDLYGMEVRDYRPINANYFIDGVGDEGVVLVLPGPRDGGKGVVVTVIVPENYVLELRSELKREWSIA